MTNTDQFVVLGFLWGDGHQGDTPLDWRFSTKSEKVNTKFNAALVSVPHQKVVQKIADDGKFVTVITGLKLDVFQPGTPALIYDLPKLPDPCRREFLAGVITGEGSQEGLVLDDPLHSRAKLMVEQLGLEGIRATIEGTNYFRVYANPDDWSKFHNFPFVVWGRVPGGKPT